MPLARRFPAVLIALAGLSVAAPAFAYVDLAPNLAKLINDSKNISVVEVTAFDRAKNRVTLKEVKALKGQASSDTVIHEVTSAEAAPVPRHILQWAEPGARAVLFVSGQTAIVCHGQGWYQVQALSARGWKLGMERPDLPLTYYGSVSRLADGVELMLAGKDAVLTVVPHGIDEAASFDLALDRAAIPGLIRVQRIRANLKMPDVVMAVSASSAYVLGQGPVDENDLPSLLKTLQSPDASVRAEAANDVGSLGTKAQSAIPQLCSLLGDHQARVRFAAAAAILRITRTADTQAIAVLSEGLAAKDTRTAAAAAISFAGKTAGPLTPKLLPLLKDPDERAKVAALQAISVLGPAAGEAAPDVKPLLDDPQVTLDAVDALGRIGPAAQPVPPQLVKMLSSEVASTRWAAVRAISQIGGEEARPAVDFMIKALPNSSEVDNYNMHIYLALLGPIAKDAGPAIRAARLKNPVLPSATLWAIDPDKNFPWQMNTRMPFGGGGGPGGAGGPIAGGGDGGRGPDITKFIYEAYINELGDRLKPAGEKLRKAILAGTTGEIPLWGYKLLNCDLDASLAEFTAHLSGKDLAMRERAAVALGYMARPAISAKPKLEEAATRAQTPNEKKLLAWALKHIQATE